MAPPRKSRNRDTEEPSTADVSANEDVEMQDQGERVNGFKKFGVSTPRRSPAKSGYTFPC
jgi:hypothetical protein